MSLTIVITRDVQERYRGFLRSAMLEIDAGVYVSRQLNREARERIWAVLSRWFDVLSRGSILMVYRDTNASGGLELRMHGIPRKDFVEADNLLLTRKRNRIK